MRKIFLSAAALFLTTAAQTEAAPAPAPQCSLENVASPDEIKSGWTLKFDPKIVDQHDSAPFEVGKGDWFVNRTTVIIPQCSAYDDMGNYSLRSYMLPKITTQTQIQICRHDERRGSVLIAPANGMAKPENTRSEIYSDYDRPYRGPCPPESAAH